MGLSLRLHLMDRWAHSGLLAHLRDHSGLLCLRGQMGLSLRLHHSGLKDLEGHWDL